MIIADILAKISHVDFRGNKNTSVNKLVKLEDLSEQGDLAWCSDKNIAQLDGVRTGTVICSVKALETQLKENCNYIITENPRLAFKNVIEEFFVEKNRAYHIESTASISTKSKISQNVSIGHNVVIADDVQVGENTLIGHNTVILKGTVIGRNVVIGCNNTIGGVGFGYEKNEEGKYELLPHLGNVVIEDNVEVGNNTAIDRAVLGSTFLRKNCKVDNLVHIAHGAEIGENSLIIANALIAGSTKIGKNVWVAPSASVLNKRTVGDNALIGMGAVVLKDVNEGEIIVGNPGKKMTK